MPQNWMPVLEYSVANCNHWWSLVLHTTASVKQHTWNNSPCICSASRVSRLYNHTHTDYVYIVCSCDRCCLLFTLNCSYAAGLLCSAGTITPELKQWMMNALVTFTPDGITAKVQSHSRNMGLISILWDKPLTHSLTYFPHSVCPLLNTDYPPSVMWMLCRPVFMWSSVRPNAATVPICRP